MRTGLELDSAGVPNETQAASLDRWQNEQSTLHEAPGAPAQFPGASVALLKQHHSFDCDACMLVRHPKSSRLRMSDKSDHTMISANADYFGNSCWREA